MKKVQQVETQLSDDPAIQTHDPVGVVVDNATRWLSQLAMIDRALVLQPFYDPFIQRVVSEWNKANLTKGGSARKGARMPFFLREENRITSSDWRVLQALRDILLDFQLVVKALEGDGQGKHRKAVQQDEIEPPLSGEPWLDQVALHYSFHAVNELTSRDPKARAGISSMHMNIFSSLSNLPRRSWFPSRTLSISL